MRARGPGRRAGRVRSRPTASRRRVPSGGRASRACSSSLPWYSLPDTVCNPRDGVKGMPVATYVRDHAGRLYRVGETDVEASGRSRRTVLWAAWAAMLAAGIGQYGFGALIPQLQ